MYPSIQPYKAQQLPVDDLHSLYVEESGNPDGVPVLFLHGGPGASCEPCHRQYFNPERYRIVLFDQRGSGQSTPHAELTDNTTWHLVDDIERIRQQLGIKKWILFGGSWGSTLSLAYAEVHPDHVLGLILRGIFLCRDEDIQWFYQHGASRLYPDAWQSFLAPIPNNERTDMVAAYYHRLTSENEIERMAAAKAWSVWEGTTATLEPDKSIVDYFSDPFMALSIARIECHYFMHKSFLKPNQLLLDAQKIAHLPCEIIHGRHDVICPVDQALALHQALPESHLHIIENAGHAAKETGIGAALVVAADKMLSTVRD